MTNTKKTKKTNAMESAMRATNVMTAKEISANAKSAGAELIQGLEIVAKAVYALAVLAIEFGRFLRSEYNKFYSRNDEQTIVVFIKKIAKAVSTKYTKVQLHVSKSDRLAMVRQSILEVRAQINALPSYLVQLGQSVQIK